MAPENLEDLEVILSTKVTSAACNLPPATMNEMAEAGTFPKPLIIPGSRRLGWRKSEIREWLEGLQHRPAKSAVA